MPTPPYTTKTGLKIGSAYQRYQRPSMDADAYRLQRALLTSDKELRELASERRLAVGMTVALVVVVGLLAGGAL